MGDNDEFTESTPKKSKGHSRVGKGGIPQANPFVEMLKDATVEQAVPYRKVAVLDDTNTVAEALKVWLLGWEIESWLVLLNGVGMVNSNSICSLICANLVVGRVWNPICTSLGPGGAFENSPFLLWVVLLAFPTQLTHDSVSMV